MAVEYTAPALQTVDERQNVLFTDTIVPCSRGYVIHREGSGVVTLRGLTNQCRARYIVHFGANISIPTGGDVEAISLAIALNGEPLTSATMIATPAAVEEFFNVSATTYVDVPRGCCLTVTVQNTSGQAIDVQNANIIIDRVA